MVLDFKQCRSGSIYVRCNIVFANYFHLITTRGVAREFRQGGARPDFPTKGCGRGEIFPDKGVAHITIDDQG